MSGPWAQFKTDRAKETEGTWVDFSGFRLKLRRASNVNKAFSKAYSEGFLRRFAKELDSDTLDDEIALPVLAAIYGETIVSDWDAPGCKPHHLPGPDGKPLAYSPEAAAAMLADLPEVLRIVQQQAGRLATFLAGEIEADAKN